MFFLLDEENPPPPRQLSAVVYPAEATQDVEWSLDGAQGIITLSPTGLVTPIGEGEVDVVATAKGYPNITDTCHVTVLKEADEPKNVIVKPRTLTLSPGDTYKLEAEVQPETVSQEVEWSLAKTTDVVSIAPDGTVTANKPGTASVKAAAKEKPEVFGTCDVTVADVPKPEDIEIITYEDPSLAVGKTLKLEVRIYPEYIPCTLK